MRTNGELNLPAPARDMAAARRFKAPRAIAALVMREMSTTYGRSFGGYFWAVAEPVAGIALLSFIFSLALRAPPIGTNFAIFYATGFLPFSMFRYVQQKTAACLRFSRPLLFYPTVSFGDALIARFLLTLLTQLLVFYLVIFMILTLWETRTMMQPELILSSLGAAAVLGVGIGTLNCYLFWAVPVWEQIWGVINRPLLLVSGVIFLHESVPLPWRDYLWWNPLVHMTGQMRRGFYPQYQGDYITMVFPYAVGLVTLVIGLILLNRYNRDMLNFY